MAIFLVHDSYVVLSVRMSYLGRGGFCVFGSLMVSRTELQENVMVAHSRLLITIRPRYFFLTCLRFMRAIEVGHSTQCQNLSSDECDPHPARHASLRTV